VEAQFAMEVQTRNKRSLEDYEWELEGQ